jgi:hypothetical protein
MRLCCRAAATVVRAVLQGLEWTWRNSLVGGMKPALPTTGSSTMAAISSLLALSSSCHHSVAPRYARGLVMGKELIHCGSRRWMEAADKIGFDSIALNDFINNLHGIGV